VPKRVVLVTVLGTALAVAGAAAPKEPDRAEVCGTTCRWIYGEQQVWRLIGDWPAVPFVQAKTPKPAPYFTFSIDSTRETAHWLLVWAPSRRLVRITQVAVPPSQLEQVGPYWRAVPAAARAVFTDATRGLRAHAPSNGWRLSPKPRWTWASLHRPLRIAEWAPGTPCRVSPRRSVTLAPGDTSPLPGPGPAYPVLAPGTVLQFFWPVPSSSEFYGSGWSGQKVMWIVAAGYRGPVLVRGRRLDGPELVRFERGAPPPTELKLRRTLTTQGSAVRRIPSYTRVQAPGCYAYQIDGTTFSRTIVFEAQAVVP
jgi:hypothetical protein